LASGIKRTPIIWTKGQVDPSSFSHLGTMFNEAKSNMEGLLGANYGKINIVFDSATKGSPKSIQSTKSWMPLEIKGH
jgi:hypothetical protein